MDSNSSGKWTIGEASTTIMAVVLRAPGEMRYTDIQNEFDRVHRPMSPRTLSRALDSLVSHNRLSRRSTGKQRWYSITEPQPTREELIDITIASDILAIQSASAVGVLGRLDFATIYGVDKRLSRRLDLALLKEARRFQEALDEILFEEMERVAQSLILKTGEKLNKKEKADARRAIDYFASGALEVGSWLKSTIWESQMVEKYFPTSIETWATNWVNKFPGKDKGEDDPAIRRKQVEYIAQLTGYSTDMVAKEINQSNKHAVALGRLLDALPEKDREKAFQQLSAMLYLMANWCAVVH